jgi:hypothetical protein
MLIFQAIASHGKGSVVRDIFKAQSASLQLALAQQLAR